MNVSDIDLINIQNQLHETFDVDDLKTLCSDLGVDFEDLAGDTKTAKVRELIKSVYRLGRIADLVKLCQNLRPNVVWDQPAKVYGKEELPVEWVEPLQRLYRLVKEFNRNRHRPFSVERTRQGDEIAFSMREAAPFLFNLFDVQHWLNSSNIGKRLAAIKYLEWLQDIEFVNDLLGKLVTETPFVQSHVLLAIDSQIDQLDEGHQKMVQLALAAYQLVPKDSSRDYWGKRILARLESP